jgi:hypothetical protein
LDDNAPFSLFMFDYDSEAMEAVQKWAAHLAKITTGLEVVASA